MDISKRRVGRPKTPSRSGPLVLDEDRAREKLELNISATTARELAEYAAWVELSSSLTTADAMSTTVDFALRDVFRRDRVWQDRRRTSARAQAREAQPATPPSPSPSHSPSPSPTTTATALSLPAPNRPAATVPGTTRP